MTIILPILQFAKQLSDDREDEWAFDDDDSGNVAESFDESKVKRDDGGRFSEQEGRSLSAKSEASAIADKAPISDSGPESSGDSKKHRPIDTPEFKRWFRDSKVVDGDGKPLVMYHGRPGGDEIVDFDFGKANQNDPDIPVIGVHFTSLREEAERSGRFPWGRPNSEEASVAAVYLAISNPATRRQILDVARELRTATNQEITDELIRRGFDGAIMKQAATVSDEQRARIEAGERVEVAPGRYLQKDKEYGGVDYFTDFVGHVTGYYDVDDFLASEETHYVAFHPTQIKSATSNRGTFDPTSKNINESSTLELSRDGQIRQITTRPVARESQAMSLREAATGLAQALVHQAAPPEPDRYRDAVVAVARRVSEFCNVPAAVLLQRHIDPEIFQKWRPGPQ